MVFKCFYVWTAAYAYCNWWTIFVLKFESKKFIWKYTLFDINKFSLKLKISCYKKHTCAAMFENVCGSWIMRVHIQKLYIYLFIQINGHIIKSTLYKIVCVGYISKSLKCLNAHGWYYINTLWSNKSKEAQQNMINNIVLLSSNNRNIF